jgi:hypothetical protein
MFIGNSGNNVDKAATNKEAPDNRDVANITIEKSVTENKIGIIKKQ